MNDIIDNTLIRLFSYRVLIVITSIIAAIVGLKFLSGAPVDPLIIFSVVAVGCTGMLFALRVSLKNPVIPYLMLQLIMVVVFFDKKFFSLAGMSLKSYALIFGVSFLIAVYYFFKHLGYLWKNFPIFRCLLLFFCMNVIYFILNYYSDFRLTNNYLNAAAVQLAALHGGVIYSGMSRQFSDEAGIVVYMDCLIPIVCIIVSLMTFYGLSVIEEINNRILTITKYTLFAFILFFAGSAVSILMGTSRLYFYDGRLWGFPLETIIASMFLLLFIGFKCFMNQLEEFKHTAIINALLNLSILTLMSMILLQINKTSIIAVSIALIALSLLNLKAGIKARFLKDLSLRDLTAENFIYKFLAYLPFVIVIVLIVQNMDFIRLTLENFGARFSSINTLEMRKGNWKYFLDYWIGNLTAIKLLFGYGIDRARETMFFISSMMTFDQYKTSPHNLYILMFFEHGAVALLFFGAFISSAISSLKHVFSVTSSIYLKLFSNISLSIIVYSCIAWMAEDYSILHKIAFICLIGVLESVKFAYSKLPD